MRILVTGGAGFIGSNYLHHEVENKPYNNYICLDLLTYAGNYNNIKDLEDKNNFKFIKGDIADYKLVDSIFEKEKIDLVINFAAESHVDNSIQNPLLFTKTNVIGTQTLLEICRKYGNIRFHQISTDEVYGELNLDSKEKFREDSLIKPNNPYSTTKACADLLVLSYYKTYKLPITISRCTNNFGPYQYPEKLIPMTITSILNNEKITIHGKGISVRDWISVKDHINAINLIIEKGSIGEVYNICSKEEISVQNIVKIILNKLGKNEDLIMYVKDRLHNDLRYSMDSSKIEKELNWKKQYNFEEEIEETIKWYINNQDWLEDIRNRKFQ